MALGIAPPAAVLVALAAAPGLAAIAGLEGGAAGLEAAGLAAVLEVEGGGAARAADDLAGSAAPAGAGSNFFGVLPGVMLVRASGLVGVTAEAPLFGTIAVGAAAGAAPTAPVAFAPAPAGLPAPSLPATGLTPAPGFATEASLLAAGLVGVAAPTPSLAGLVAVLAAAVVVGAVADLRPASLSFEGTFVLAAATVTSAACA